MRRVIPIGAAVVYGVAAFPAALADDLAGGVDVALLVVPFCAVFALAFLPWGRLADRVGAAPVLIASTAGLGLAGILLAVAADPLAVGAARGLQGALAAGFPPAAQALLTRTSTAGAGRAVGGMMIGVGCGTLGAPLLALALGSSAALWLLGVAAPLALAATLAVLARALPAPAGAARAARLRPTSGLLAGWAVSALVLSAYWTLLTRVDDLLGSGGAGLDSGAAHVLTLLAGAAGLALVPFAARATDRRGPRVPMAAVLGAGGGALLAAALAPAAVAVAGLLVLLALYWSYLPVVSVQVARSAPPELRATAIAGLYSAMWFGAAAGGIAGAALPGWRSVLLLGAMTWLGAAAIAARHFESEPAAMMAAPA
jgi:MFS family permease